MLPDQLTYNHPLLLLGKGVNLATQVVLTPLLTKEE